MDTKKTLVWSGILRGLLFVLLFPPVALAGINYTTTGAGGGGWMYSGTYHHTDSDIMLYGGDMNGLFRTDDGGLTWEPWNEGLLVDEPGHTGYVQDLISIDYDGTGGGTSFSGFYAATVGGIFRAPDTGGWVELTPRNQGFYYKRTDESEVKRIPFSCLDWNGVDTVYAGAGLNRYECSTVGTLSFFTNSWKAYPDLVYGVKFLEYCPWGDQYTVWKSELANGIANWEPLIGTVPEACPVGAALDISVQQFQGVDFVVVSTRSGVYIWNGTRWIDLTGWPLIHVSDGVGSYSYGTEFSPYGIHLSERGDLYACMYKYYHDAANLPPNGVYRAFGCVDTDTLVINPYSAFFWIGNGDYLETTDDLTPGICDDLYNQSLADYGSAAVDGDQQKARFCFLSVIDGTDDDPDVLYLANASVRLELVRGVQPYVSSWESATWKCKIYKQNSQAAYTPYQWDASEVRSTVDMGWRVDFGLNFQTEVFFSDSDPVDVAAPANGSMFTATDDNQIFVNSAFDYNLLDDGWLTRGFGQIGVNDIAFTGSGSVIYSCQDEGTILGVDSDLDSFNNLYLPYDWQWDPEDDTIDGSKSGRACQTRSDWNGSGFDAHFMIIGYPTTTHHDGSKGNKVFMLHELDGQFRNMTPHAPGVPCSTGEYIYYDLFLPDDDVCYVSYESQGSFGVLRGVYTDPVWTWEETDMPPGVPAGVKGFRFAKAAGTDRIFLGVIRSEGGIYTLEDSDDTTWYGSLEDCGKIHDLSISPDGQFAVGGGNTAQIYFSSNADILLEGNITWNEISPPAGTLEVEALAMSPYEDEQRFFAGLSFGAFKPGTGLYQYDRTTRTWTYLVSDTDLEGVRITSLEFDPNVEGQLLIGTSGQGIHYAYIGPLDTGGGGGTPGNPGF